MFSASDKQRDSESPSHDCKTILLDFVNNALDVPKRNVQIRLQISLRLALLCVQHCGWTNQPANVAASWLDVSSFRTTGAWNQKRHVDKKCFCRFIKANSNMTGQQTGAQGALNWSPTYTLCNACRLWNETCMYKTSQHSLAILFLDSKERHDFIQKKIKSPVSLRASPSAAECEALQRVAVENTKAPGDAISLCTLQKWVLQRLLYLKTIWPLFNQRLNQRCVIKDIWAPAARIPELLKLMGILGELPLQPNWHQVRVCPPLARSPCAQ